jgi:TonB family protein
MPKQEKREQSNKTNSAVIVRQANIMRIDESQNAPKGISVTPNLQKSRPNGYFLVSDEPETGEFHGSSTAKSGRDNNSVGIGIQDSQPKQIEETRKAEPPPPLIKKTLVETKQKSIVVSDGVVNGKAKYLPKPIYTAAAKAVKAGGDVNVQVTIDEVGSVISAKAVGGHPLLKFEAEKAARDAKFHPTLLSNQPVKVSGVIVYKFSMQ